MTPNLLDELEVVVRVLDRAGKLDYEEYADGKVVLTGPKSAIHALAASTRFLRTHAPALADMAKRLEAAERDVGKCWAMHLKGPDDVVAAPSREAAEIVARNFNAYWDAHKHERDHDVRVVAEVIEWEHGAVDHARSVAEHWPEYTDLLDATQEGEG